MSRAIECAALETSKILTGGFWEANDGPVHLFTRCPNVFGSLRHRSVRAVPFRKICFMCVILKLEGDPWWPSLEITVELAGAEALLN